MFDDANAGCSVLFLLLYLLLLYSRSCDGVGLEGSMKQEISPVRYLFLEASLR